jgi:D-serine deaminase-like pyridoxal phosphate-dependent protein
MFAEFSLATLPTPALVVDAAIVRNNVHRMAEYAAARRLLVRPHTKTHKTCLLARLQLECGAPGLTIAKLGEAETMSDVADDLLLAYPALDPWRARYVAELARRKTMRVAVDSLQAVEALAAEAVSVHTTIGILVDLDVGMHRTGVQSPQAALELAQAVDRAPYMRLDGLMCYPGHIWNRPQEQQPPLAKVAAQMQETLDLWSHHGLHAQIVSGGSTPTAYQSHQVPQLTEIRPGTYIYNDMNTVRGGFCTLDDCAARIICTVVSNAVANQIVLDGGTKTLTSDQCIPARDSGHGYIVEYPNAKIVALSEEHGQVDVSQCDRRPRLGERVTVIPNHICPCVNLQNDVWWNDGPHPLERLAVDARGQLV